MPPRPELTRYGALFWPCFVDLHDARNSGFSIGAIPPSEVVAWLDLNQIVDPDVRHDFARVVRLVDRAFLANREEWRSDSAGAEPSESQTGENAAEMAHGKPRRRRR